MRSAVSGFALMFFWPGSRRSRPAKPRISPTSPYSVFPGDWRASSYLSRTRSSPGPTAETGEGSERLWAGLPHHGTSLSPIFQSINNAEPYSVSISASHHRSFCTAPCNRTSPSKLSLPHATRLIAIFESRGPRREQSFRPRTAWLYHACNARCSAQIEP